MSKIDLATELATKAHEGQVRKYVGEPYVQHPLRVAARVSRVPHATEEMVAAAILHDTVEDTDLTLEEIERALGPVVARYVDGLTDKFDAESAPGMNRKARKQAEAERLAKEPREVQVIKLADIADNLVGTDPADSFADVFLREKVTLMALIGHADGELLGEVEEAAGRLRIAYDKATAEKKAAKAAKLAQG